MKLPYATVKVFSASTERIGVESPMAICQNTVHSLAPSIAADSNSSLGRLSKNPFSRKIMYPFAIVGRISAQKVFTIGEITIHPLQAKVYRDGQELFLTTMEYRLLLALAQAEGQVLTRNQLLESLWDIGGDYVNDNTLTVYIKRLREKLGGENEVIQTVRGLGYRLGDV